MLGLDSLPVTPVSMQHQDSTRTVQAVLFQHSIVSHVSKAVHFVQSGFADLMQSLSRLSSSLGRPASCPDLPAAASPCLSPRHHSALHAEADRLRTEVALLEVTCRHSLLLVNSATPKQAMSSMTHHAFTPSIQSCQSLHICSILQRHFLLCALLPCCRIHYTLLAVCMTPIHY